MERVRLDVSLAQWPRLRVAGPTVAYTLSCADATTVEVAAALRGTPGEPRGVWIEVTPDYPAPLVARDVATLSWLIALDHVVIASSRAPAAQADVVRALMGDGEVTLVNEVATLRGAYNRPAPPRPVTIWWFDGALHDGDVTLEERARRRDDQGEWTTYA